MRLSSGQERGFTLIEILTVIIIIAALAALLVPAAQRTLDRARSAQAKNDVTQIVTAVNAYYTEYGRYPVYTPPATDSDFSNAGALATNGGEAFTNMGDNGLLVDVLRNNTNAAGTNLTWVQNMNPRGIVFLQVPIAKSTTSPVGGVAPSGATSPGTWYDPWGNAYRMRIDTNYNNLVNGPYAANAGTSAASANLMQGVITWSLGKDHQTSPADKNVGTGKDDVISWQ